MYSFFMCGVSWDSETTHPFFLGEGGGGTVTGHSGDKNANVGRSHNKRDTALGICGNAVGDVGRLRLQ